MFNLTLKENGDSLNDGITVLIAELEKLTAAGSGLVDSDRGPAGKRSPSGTRRPFWQARRSHVLTASLTEEPISDARVDHPGLRRRRGRPTERRRLLKAAAEGPSAAQNDTEAAAAIHSLAAYVVRGCQTIGFRVEGTQGSEAVSAVGLGP
jgi:hypothetical protein